MTVEQFRKIMEGTGAQIIESPAPTCVFELSPFQIIEHTDPRWADGYSGADPYKGTFIAMMIPEVLPLQGTHGDPSVDVERTRAKFGGKRIIAYDCVNFDAVEKGDQKVPVIRYYQVPSKAQRRRHRRARAS